MKKLKQYIFLSLLLIRVFSVFAQYENTTDIGVIKRKIKLRALETISLYENLCSVRSDYEEVDFLKLFVSSKTPIIDDIMPDNMLNKQLPVIEYKEKRDSFHNEWFIITVKPYAINFMDIDETTLTGNLWIDAYKAIQAVDKNNDKKYIDTLDIRVSIQFNYSTETYKISEISLNKARGKYAILQFYVKDFGRQPKKVNGPIVLNNVTVLTDDSDSSFFIKNITDTSFHKITLKTNDGNITEKLNYNDVEQAAYTHGDQKNIVKILFKSPFLFSELSYSFMPGSTSPIHADQKYSPIAISNGSAYSFGASIGIIAHKWRGGYWHIKTGLAYTQLTYSLFLGRYTESYTATDADNTSYLRTNTITGIHESNTINYLSVPLVIEKGIYLPKKFKAVLQIGSCMLMGVNGTYTTSANAEYTGDYKDFFGMHIGENGVYDFGKFSINKQQGRLNTKKNMLGITAYTGIARNITQKMQFNVGFSYLYTLKNLYNNSNKKLSSNNAEANSITDIYNRFKINLYTITASTKWIF